jgi:hypothetical protein
MSIPSLALELLDLEVLSSHDPNSPPPSEADTEEDLLNPSVRSAGERYL